MRDIRVSIFDNTPLVVSTNTTVNGSTLTLLDGYTIGSYFEGSPAGYGLGVEVLLTSITGTRIDVAFKWQVSDDASTWVDDVTILDDTNLMTLTTGGTKLEFGTRLKTTRKYARIVLTTTDVSGSGTFTLRAWLGDGTEQFGGKLQHYRI